MMGTRIDLQALQEQARRMHDVPLARLIADDPRRAQDLALQVRE